jgi:micrococcal nuclease
MRKFLLILAVILMTSSYSLAENTVNWKDAASHYGKYKTVEGKIVSGKCLPKVCFLNFDKDYKTTFTVVIFASDLPKFPPKPDQYYRNKKVQVSGTIKEYRGKPEIILKEPDQINIVK